MTAPWWQLLSFLVLGAVFGWRAFLAWKGGRYEFPLVGKSVERNAYPAQFWTLFSLQLLFSSVLLVCGVGMIIDSFRQ